MSRREGTLKLKDALRLASRLGAEVALVHRTGEVRIKWGGLVVTHNARLKDANMALMNLIHKAEKAKEDE
jgi:hypothetical protein